eukprot:9893526-Prorocentrum_lima.AAC.1
MLGTSAGLPRCDREDLTRVRGRQEEGREGQDTTTTNDNHAHQGEGKGERKTPGHPATADYSHFRAPQRFSAAVASFRRV